jgi:hypothetical protein
MKIKKDVDITTAEEVKRALAARHKNDLFFTEVKDGPTQTVNHHSKVDALAIRLSWTQFNITGYEVKVSRSDFLRDEKWRAYLPMCNQLYWVVLDGVCDELEIPECCGLIRYRNGRLSVIKKAPSRDIEPPVDMYKYLMFNYIGALQKREATTSRTDRLLPSEKQEVFEAYLKDKIKAREVGYKTGCKLAQKLRDAEYEIENLKRRMDDERKFDNEKNEICKALGVEPYYGWLDRCLQSIQQLKTSGGVTTNAVKAACEANKQSAVLMKEIGIGANT